jgi:hypothetical protein
VSPDILYYVNQQFDSQYRNSDRLYRVEKEVESEYKQYLGQLCGEQKRIRQNKIYQSKWGSSEARKKADATPIPACNEWKERFQPRY